MADSRSSNLPLRTVKATTSTAVPDECETDQARTTCSFEDMPPEVQDQIFEEVVLAENFGSWEWSGQDTDGQSDICVAPSEMQLPSLMGVNQKIRSNFLACLFRTTTFRIDVALPGPQPHEDDWAIFRGGSVNGRSIRDSSHQQHPHEVALFKVLDLSNECSIRRLQFRLLQSDMHGRRASLNLRYLAGTNGWQVDLVVDAGFPSETNPIVTKVPDVRRPMKWEVEMMTKALTFVSIPWSCCVILLPLFLTPSRTSTPECARAIWSACSGQQLWF